MKLSGWKEKARRFVTGLALICLIIFMTSCGKQQTVIRTEYIYLLPPEEYTQSYPQPELHGSDNRALLYLGLDAMEINRLHENDKQALREWRKGVAE